MNKDQTVFLQHIIESIEAIEHYTKGCTKEQFLAMPQLQDAVMRRLETIGEAVKNLSEDFRQQHPASVWNKAMGTRNILIHHYFGIDLVIVWETVTKDLPMFKKQIQTLLKQ